MTTTRIISSSTAFDFSAAPVVVTSTIPSTINYAATGYGRSIGTNGIWNTSTRPASGTFSIAPGNDFVAPLVNTNLPAFKFDAIILLSVDGARYPIGISNSPDNLVGYTGTSTITPVNTFWTDLFCFGYNNALGNSSANNSFMFGGNGTQFSISRSYNIIFEKLLAEDLIATITIKYFTYANGYLSRVKSFSAPLTAGQYTYPIVDYNMDTDYYNNGQGLIYEKPGYVEILMTVNKPNYKSLLNYYHWGLSN